jgi:diacylglycerol kinase family enzyme
VRVIAVVHERARRGGARVAAAIRAGLPQAEVALTRDLEELGRVARSIAPEDLVVVAGGDGSAAAVLNALRSVRERGAEGARLAKVALLKLGTGNGWANSVGAPPLEFSLAELRRALEEARPLPMRRFDLVLVEGLVAQFAGTGWDAELIDDFHAQKTGPGLVPRRLRGGVFGYLNGLFTRAVPRNVLASQVEVEVENLGAPAMTVSSRGDPVDLVETRAGEPRAVLYRGPVSVCGVGTSPEWGFRFRAFPFAGRVPGRFNLRMYVGRALGGVLRMPVLWTGHHPVTHMLTWLLDDCEVRFSRPVPLQAGGDLVGHRDRIRYRVAPERVDVLDWSRLIVPSLGASPLAPFAPTVLARVRALRAFALAARG